MGPLSDSSHASSWTPRMTAGCPPWLGGNHAPSSSTPQIDTAGIHIEFLLMLFPEIKEFQTQDMSSLEGLAWLGYMRRHLLVSFLSLSFHFAHTTPPWSESLVITTSLDSVKLSVCFIAKMFRGSVESYYPNLSFFNILFFGKSEDFRFLKFHLAPPA